MTHTTAILTLGLGVALATGAAAKLPQPPDRFPDTLPWFLAGLGLALVGAVGWRRAIRKLPRRPGAGAEHCAPETLAADLPAKLAELSSRASQLSPASLRDAIDALTESHFARAASSRAELEAALGVPAVAQLLMEMAACERRLNRAWSASADGCPEEARAALAEAAAAAARLLPAAMERDR